MFGGNVDQIVSVDIRQSIVEFTVGGVDYPEDVRKYTKLFIAKVIYIVGLTPRRAVNGTSGTIKATSSVTKISAGV